MIVALKVVVVGMQVVGVMKVMVVINVVEMTKVVYVVITAGHEDKTLFSIPENR